MPNRKKRDHTTASHDEVTAKAERRFEKADKQRARIKADPKEEVSRAQGRVKDAKNEKPS
jgi:hypothetical protein